MPSASENAVDVIAIVRQWIEMRLAHGSLSPIVTHELRTVLQIIRDECDSREVPVP